VKKLDIVKKVPKGDKRQNIEFVLLDTRRQIADP